MKILKFFLFFFVGFMSCSEHHEYDILEQNVSNSEDSKEYNHYLISRKNAVIKVQKVLDILYNKDITRCDVKSKTVNEKGILDGVIHSTRGEQSRDCAFYVIPFEQNGYSIVDANDCEIISIIPNGCITRSEIDEQIELVQKQIKFEDNLLKLEECILTEQKNTESDQILASDSITDLGDVIYSDLWNRDEGYTVWFDQVDDVDIYTLGYSTGISNDYIATYYINSTDTVRISKENNIYNTQESLFMEELLSKNESPMNTDNGSTSAPFFLNNERKINESIYLALREHAKEDAQKELDEMNDITNIEVDLHTTTCKIDGQNILSYGIKQSTGNFGTSFPNGYAGCGPVAIAAIFMQQNVHPSKIDSQWTSWDMFEKQYSDYEPLIGYSYNFYSSGEMKFSRFLRNIASQCGAHYFKEGTAVSRNHMGDFLKKYFKMIGTDVEYKDSRVKKQIDRNRLEIVYGRSHGGISGWFNQHYWVVSAYATVKCGAKTSTLVYNNTSWKDDDGWYTIGNRIGYRHKGKLFEPGDPK